MPEGFALVALLVLAVLCFGLGIAEPGLRMAIVPWIVIASIVVFAVTIAGALRRAWRERRP